MHLVMFNVPRNRLCKIYDLPSWKIPYSNYFLTSLLKIKPPTQTEAIPSYKQFCNKNEQV